MNRYTLQLFAEISIHAPARGATKQEVITRYFRNEFQFTPLREGRRIHRKPLFESFLISIHAPARGATPA